MAAAAVSPAAIPASSAGPSGMAASDWARAASSAAAPAGRSVTRVRCAAATAAASGEAQPGAVMPRYGS